MSNEMITSEYSLRPVTEEDLPKLVEIEQKVHVAPWSLAHFHAELDKPYSQVLVLTDDETDSQIAAYVVYWLMLDECEILNIAVDLPFRGLRFAKRMLRQVVNAATHKDLKRVVLDVRKTNQAAIQLYQGLGFTITQVRKNFYSNGEDAYQMTLPLKDDSIQF